MVSEKHFLRGTFLRGKRIGEVETYATKISYSFFLLKIYENLIPVEKALLQLTMIAMNLENH